MFFKWLAWVLTCATCLSIDETEFGTFIDESFELNLNDIKGKGSSLYLDSPRVVSDTMSILTVQIRT